MNAILQGPDTVVVELGCYVSRPDPRVAPGHYRWSSYRANAQGKEDKLITPHPLYKRLGRNNASRREAYPALFKAHVDEADLKDIRAAWQTGTPLGNEYFKEKIERKLGSKVGQARRGRPSKRALTP